MAGTIGLDQSVPGKTNGVVAAGITVVASVTPTVTASTYAVSKSIGGILTFPNMLPASGGAVLESIAVKFKGSAQTVGFWVSIFSAKPTGTFTDTSTAAIASADTAYLLGSYHLTTAFSLLGTHTIFNSDGIGAAINPGVSSGPQPLYAVVIPDATTGALATTSDVTVTLGALWG